MAALQMRKRRRRPAGRRRRRLLGAAGMLVLAAMVAGVVLGYQHAFTPAVPATVVADRAGLLMYPGADVTLYGVTVGRVTSITPAGGKARLGIALDPGEVPHIPANVQAAIVEPTVFGPKYLDLVVPRRPSPQRVSAGAVIQPATVSTEVDTVFANLVSLLQAVHPAKLSATLGAVSTALQGRGAKLGAFIAELNAYLHGFNPNLPALAADLHVAPSVLSTYASAAPNLIGALGNLRVTSGTLARRQAQLAAFLSSLRAFSGNTRGFLAGNERALAATLATLAPTSALLAEYSPEFGCLFASSAQMQHMSKSSRIILHSTLLPGQRGYKYPRDLPLVRAASAPSCYGGPLTPAEAAHYPRIVFNDGTARFFSRSDRLSLGSPPLAVQLFGPLAATPRQVRH